MQNAMSEPSKSRILQRCGSLSSLHRCPLESQRNRERGRLWLQLPHAEPTRAGVQFPARRVDTSDLFLRDDGVLLVRPFHHPVRGGDIFFTRLVARIFGPPSKSG